jgi:hypothetical protein
LPDGNKRLTVEGIPYRTYIVQATALIEPATWSNIGTNETDAGGAFVFDDLEATNFVPTRFYRSVRP